MSLEYKYIFEKNRERNFERKSRSSFLIFHKENCLLFFNCNCLYRILWPPHVKSWLIGKDSDAGRDWGQEEKGTTEDEMAGWHHWLDICESEWTLGDGDGQGGLACCDSWGCRESDMTEWLNWTDAISILIWLVTPGSFLLYRRYICPYLGLCFVSLQTHHLSFIFHCSLGPRLSSVFERTSF